MADIVSKKKNKTGVVVKVSGKDTVAVEIQGLKRHLLYGKVVRFNKKYLVHDEGNTTKPGDIVSIIEGRPISKLKRWRLVGNQPKVTAQSSELDIQVQLSDKKNVKPKAEKSLTKKGASKKK